MTENQFAHSQMMWKRAIHKSRTTGKPHIYQCSMSGGRTGWWGVSIEGRMPIMCSTVEEAWRQALQEKARVELWLERRWKDGANIPWSTT